MQNAQLFLNKTGNLMFEVVSSVLGSSRWFVCKCARDVFIFCILEHTNKHWV